MNLSMKSKWLGFFLLACFFAASSSVRCASKDSNPDLDIRHLHFPQNISLGPLFVLRPHRDDPNSLHHLFENGQQVGGGMGDVTVTVPRDNLLILDANRRIFENPALLKMVSPFGIDVLKIRFNSIADNEDNLLDGTFKYVNDLKGLQMLDVDESETTDANLSKLKQLPHLRTISCLNTEINGDCFKDLAALPALTELILTNCPIKESNLKYLQKFPRLSILDLGVHGHHVMAHHLHYLTQTGVQDIAKCHGIVNLNVSEQTRFDDSCLKYLAEMKNLRYLYLTNTSITLNGLSALRGLKLKQIALPSTLHKNAAEVARIFPHTVCKIADSPPSQAARSVSNDSRANDINVIFSPLR